MQKSFEGLLRCILYQIIRQSEGLTNLLLNFEIELLKKDSHRDTSIIGRPSRGKPWERYLLLFQARICERWTKTSLENALFFILQQTSEDMRLLLFLDALDEFEGEPKSIAMFLVTCVQKAKMSSTQLKICFASRPWNAFNDYFIDVPYFRMEDHTRTDIERYVEAMFRDHTFASGNLASSNPRRRKAIQNLQVAIQSRAQGVFLWVRLVLDMLLDRMADGESIEELKQSLAMFPDQLEDLYVALIDRVAPKYRREAYVMLEIVLRSEVVLDPLSLWNIMQCTIRQPQVFHLHTSAEQSDETPEMDTILRRIRSRCGGLIEEIRSTPEHDFFGINSNPPLCRVQLMHQTVREFLLLPETRRHFLHSDDSLYTLNGHWFLSRSFFSMAPRARLEPIQRLPYGSEQWLRRNSESCLFHAKQAEISTGHSLLTLMNEFKPGMLAAWYNTLEEIRSEADMYPANRVILLQSYPRLLFAIVAKLRITLQEILDSIRFEPRILGYFIFPMLTAKQYSTTSTELPRLDTTVLKILLAAGADTTVRVNDLTAFASLLISMTHAHNGIEPAGLEALRLILLYNPRQHLDADIIDTTDRSNLGIRLSEKPLHMASERSVYSVIELLLRSGAEVNALSSCGRTPLDMVKKEADISDECEQLLRAYGGKLSKELARKTLSTRMKLLLKRIS